MPATISGVTVPAASPLVQYVAGSGLAVGFCLWHQAWLIALMIGPSSMRFKSSGFCGDWPCLAVMMIAVEDARPFRRIWSTIRRSCALT